MTIYGHVTFDTKTGHMDRSGCEILSNHQIYDFIQNINDKDRYYSCYDLMWYVRDLYHTKIILVCSRDTTDEDIIQYFRAINL